MKYESLKDKNILYIGDRKLDFLDTQAKKLIDIYEAKSVSIWDERLNSNIYYNYILVDSSTASMEDINNELTYVKGDKYFVLPSFSSEEQNFIISKNPDKTILFNCNIIKSN